MSNKLLISIAFRCEHTIAWIYHHIWFDFTSCVCVGGMGDVHSNPNAIFMERIINHSIRTDTMFDWLLLQIQPNNETAGASMHKGKWNNINNSNTEIKHR